MLLSADVYIYIYIYTLWCNPVRKINNTVQLPQIQLMQDLFSIWRVDWLKKLISIAKWKKVQKIEKCNNCSSYWETPTNTTSNENCSQTTAVFTCDAYAMSVRKSPFLVFRDLTTFTQESSVWTGTDGSTQKTHLTFSRALFQGKFTLSEGWTLPWSQLISDPCSV